MDWDEIYKNYPLKDIPWHSEKPSKSLVLALKKIKPDNALDVCCGAGTNVIYLAQKGFKVKGIDFSETAIEISRKKAQEAGVEIDFKVLDALDFKEKEKYDFIFDRGCFHHLTNQNKPKFVKIIYNALKSGGHYLLLAFSDKNKFEKSLTKVQIKEYFAQFSLGKFNEEVHEEPGGLKVYLHSILMTKR